MTSRSPVRAAVIALLFALSFLAPAKSAHAQGAYLHVVREGETLASIAQQYYGDPRRELVLVVENGLAREGGGASIVAGMRLLIPWVTYHRVAPGETWAVLAERFYGDTRRQFLLMESNRTPSRGQPPEGAEVLVPYPLRYVTGKDETMRHIAQTFYDDSKASLRMLTRMNGTRPAKLPRGILILVPMADLVLSDDGRRRVEETLGHPVEGGEVKVQQERAEKELPLLIVHGRKGEFAEAVALGNRLLGTGNLTGTQLVTIQRELGLGYVALGRPDLAQHAFEQVLELQPEIELSAITTSPKVLAVFQAAKAAAQKREAAAAKEALSNKDPVIEEPDAEEDDATAKPPRTPKPRRRGK